MLVPCRNCQDRVLGCHSTCEKYQAYKTQANEIAEKRRKGVENHMSYLDYKYEKTKRLGGKYEQR